jgi:hypothetical protein
MVQCLREIGAKEPIHHQPSATEAETTPPPGTTDAATPGTTGAAGAEAAAAADDADPFGGAAEADAMEAEPAETEPADDAGGFGVEDEDPFGNDE